VEEAGVFEGSKVAVGGASAEIELFDRSAWGDAAAGSIEEGQDLGDTLNRADRGIGLAPVAVRRLDGHAHRLADRGWRLNVTELMRSCSSAGISHSSGVPVAHSW
jgi:hypothetical protein